MANKKTLGSQAESARRKGERRIERLDSVIRADNVSERIRNWAIRQKHEIKSAIQGTRQYSKEGKRYKSKSKSYIQAQIERLNQAVSEVAPRYTATGDTFEVTQRELNRASIKQPSVYTQTEAKLFYRATQKIWQKEGVGEHDRNEAILEHFNSERKAKGLKSLSLEEVVEYVLKSNRKFEQWQNLNPSEEMSPEQQEFYEKAAAADNADGDAGSPPGITQVIVSAIQDALSGLLILPNPTAI